MWTIDLTAPEATITSGPASSTNETDATLAFTSNEPGSTFECSLDAVGAGTFEPCTSPKSYDGLPGGARTFQVRAKDAAGNIGPPDTHSWSIDLSGPAATILTGPPGLTNSTSASFTFSGSEAGTTFECSLDRVLFSSCASPQAYGNLQTARIRSLCSRDRLERQRRPEQRTPGTSTHAHTAAAVTAGPARSDEQHGPQRLPSPRTAVLLHVNSTPGAACSALSPSSYPGPRRRPHTFVVRPTDAVGNPGAAALYTWTVDGTAPETTLGSRPRTGTKALTATFTFSASEAAGFECRLDGAAFQPCASPKGYARLGRSAHRFEVRAVDRAGNPDPSPAIHRWTVGAAPRRAAGSSALLAPRAGARVTRPPFLRWARFRGRRTTTSSCTAVA